MSIVTQNPVSFVLVFIAKFRRKNTNEIVIDPTFRLYTQSVHNHYQAIAKNDCKTQERGRPYIT